MQCDQSSLVFSAIDYQCVGVCTYFEFSTTLFIALLCSALLFNILAEMWASVCTLHVQCITSHWNPLVNNFKTHGHNNFPFALLYTHLYVLYCIAHCILYCLLLVILFIYLFDCVYRTVFLMFLRSANINTIHPYTPVMAKSISSRIWYGTCIVFLFRRASLWNACAELCTFTNTDTNFVCIHDKLDRCDCTEWRLFNRK